MQPQYQGHGALSCRRHPTRHNVLSNDRIPCSLGEKTGSVVPTIKGVTSMGKRSQAPAVTAVIAKSLLAVGVLVLGVQAGAAGQCGKASQIQGCIFPWHESSYEHSLLHDLPLTDSLIAEQPESNARARGTSGDGLQTKPEVTPARSCPPDAVTLTPPSSLWSRDCWSSPTWG